MAAAPGAGAQAVDCNNIPDMAVAEPAEYAQCAPPLVVATPGQFGALPAFGVNLRASAPTGRGFITFDYADGGSAAIVGADDAAFFAGDFEGNDFATLYAVESLDIPTLYAIDVGTGTKTSIGSTGIAAASNVGGMAWDYETSTMFATSGANLYTVNTTTGAMTLVAPITGLLTTPINLLAHPNTGVLYAVDLATDELFSIDKATGVSTLIGAIGYALNFAQGGDFDNASGVGYICAYEGAGVNSIRSLDLTTGASTAVSAFTNSEVDWCASMNPLSGTAIEAPASNDARFTAEPNPFSQRTQLLLTAGEDQQVRVDVYDIVGRHVATLFDAQVHAGQPTVVSLEAQNLRPGVYVVRATGQTFVKSQQLTVAR